LNGSKVEPVLNPFEASALDLELSDECIGTLLALDAFADELDLAPAQLATFQNLLRAHRLAALNCGYGEGVETGRAIGRYEATHSL
jgi:hypothetical protein